MSLRVPLFLASGAALASCSIQANNSYVDQLVERFDVEQCSDVEFTRAGAHPDQSKTGGLRVYIADAECIDAMHRAFEIIAFRQTGEATFQYTSDRGWADIVTLTPLNDGSGTRIDWESLEL